MPGALGKSYSDSADRAMQCTIGAAKCPTINGRSMQRSTRLVVLVLFFSTSFAAVAQTSFVYQRLRMIMNGKADEVRKELVELSKEMPEDAGVMFLQAAVTEDGAKAVALYERITRDFPENEWADDAQLRLVQYHALRRDTARAQRELANFKRSYALSEYLVFAHDLVKNTVGIGKEGLKPGTPAASANTATSNSAAANSSTSATATPVTATGVSVNESSAKKATSKDQGALTAVPSSVPSAAPSTASAAAAGKSDEKKTWGWQVGVYSARKTADAEAQMYREQRMRVDVLDKDGKFAVVVGQYSSKESAEKSKPLVEAQCSCAPYLIEKPSGR
jgi:cell division septation protein DedD